MFVAVWLLYVADRMMDYRSGHNLEARHLFHGRNFVWFGGAAIAACGVLGYLVAHISPALLLRYLQLCAPLALYFAAIHLTQFKRYAPKEALVGIFFSAAVFLPEFASLPIAAVAVVFGLLCWLNCTAIHRWEADAPALWGARHFRKLCVLACLTATGLAYRLIEGRAA